MAAHFDRLEEDAEVMSFSFYSEHPVKDDQDSVQDKRILLQVPGSSLPPEPSTDGKHFRISPVNSTADNSFSYPTVAEKVGASALMDVIARRKTVVATGTAYGLTASLLQAKSKPHSEFDHIFYCTALPLSHESLHQTNSVDTFLQKQGMANSNGDNVLILIDQFSDKLLMPQSVLNSLLDRNLLPKCTILLGISDGSTYSNPEVTAKLAIEPRPIEEHCNVILDLVNQDYGADDTIQYIKNNCMWLCSNIELLRLTLTEFNRRAPRTLAIMMEKLILKLMKADSDSLSSLPSRTFSKLLCLCKLAYLNLDEEEFDFQDVSRCLTLGIRNVAFASMKNAGLGLLLYPSNTEETACGKCTFCHPKVKEFLAAYFIANEPLLCQINMYKLNRFLVDPKYSNLSKFYFGIGHLLNNGSSGTEQLKSEIQHVYYCLLGNLDLGIKETSNRQNILFVYELLDQAQNPDLVRKIFSKRQKELTLTLNQTKLPNSLVVAITYIITNSGVFNWSICNHRSMKNTADFIALSVRTDSSSSRKLNADSRRKTKADSSGKVAIRTAVISAEKFIVQPIMHEAGIFKPHSLDYTYVKCIREILHRTLQVFSPIKIKSSSSEISYVSFLACDCLRRRFEESQIVQFEPIQAFHWLRSPVAQQKSKKPSSRNREMQEFQDHMSRLHDMEQVELVIMVAPLPERLYYLEPHSTVRRCVELYRHDPDIFYKNSMIETSDGTFLNSEECATVETKVTASKLRNEDSYRLKFSQMVAPRLPIPKSNLNVVFEENSPQHDIAPMSLPELTYRYKMKQIEEESAAVAQPKGKLVREEVKAAVQPQLANKGIGEFSGEFGVVRTETLAQESTYSRNQIQRQVAVDAGTVLYSTMPNVFAVDARYPCPEETRLIKKGGNGAIYSVTYGNYDFAVKKTPYRSREIETHKMLKHPNIVELKCLMFGHQQPEHRRRYFSYHFMSKYSGDLSRMVTNKPELTMVTLSEKFRGNPRLLGSMQGNWKYILKEMLKGLAFMHAKNVIHRDMKASNILIKMFCNCDNLLTCTCTYKYSVCIADFDAAIPLDSNGKIPPTTVTKVPSQKNVYQVVPVGTDGYRAPESSQMIVSNDVSALDPPLTVKADIWSVGLIMIRMLNGANGPTKQQKLSILLLYYMQSKRGVSMVRGDQSRFPYILKEEIEKIIGLSRINYTDSSWMTRAVRCISKCVEVDPERRPSAESLLQDPFLY